MSDPNPPEDATGGQPQETDGVRRRRTFSFADKKRICEEAMENPRLNCSQLANHLGINKYVVRRTLLESKQWMSSDAVSRPDKARRKRPQYEPIEADLASWLRGQLDSGHQVELFHIRAEALRLAAALNASNGTQDSSMRHFKCSQKWILNFKARHGFPHEYTVGPAFRKPIGATGAKETEDLDDDSESSDEDEEAYNQYPNPPIPYPTHSQGRRSAGEGSTRAPAPSQAASLAVFDPSRRVTRSMARAPGYADHSSGAARTTIPQSNVNSGSGHHTSAGRAK